MVKGHPSSTNGFVSNTEVMYINTFPSFKLIVIPKAKPFKQEGHKKLTYFLSRNRYNMPSRNFREVIKMHARMHTYRHAYTHTHSLHNVQYFSLVLYSKIQINEICGKCNVIQ